jgi:hypothetical protein
VLGQPLLERLQHGEEQREQCRRKIAMAANWPTCTAVQLPLRAYSADTVAWLLAGPSAWNWVTTIYRSCPISSSVADRRSAGMNVLVFMITLLL